MPQQYLTTGFDEKRCVLRARRTSFFRHFLIYGPTAHKFKRPDKTLYSVQKKSPVFAKTSYSPCFSKNEALRRRFKPSGTKSCRFRSSLNDQRNCPRLSITGTENRQGKLAKRRIEIEHSHDALALIPRFKNFVIRKGRQEPAGSPRSSEKKRWGHDG
jgi:hypothetical protein